MARRWSRVILNSPRVVLLLTSLLAVLSLLVAARRMEIRPSRAELVFTDQRLAQLKRAYKREFPDRDGVVVVVDATDLSRAKQFVSSLAVRLQSDPEHIAEVFYRVDEAPFEAHSLQYLTPEELEGVYGKIDDHRELIRDVTTAPGLNTLFAGINREMGQALVGHFFTGFLEEENKSGEVDLGFLNSMLRQVRDWSNGVRSFGSPWGAWLGTGKEPVSEGYLLTAGKRYLVLLANIRETGGQSLVPNRESIERIRTAIAELRREYPGIEAGVTGSDALASDEMVTARRDATVATILAIVGVTFLFIMFWKNILTPLRALLSLAVGVCWTFGFISLTVGSLNILSAMFIPILIGLGIDYNVHILERFREERAAGYDPGEALENTLRKAGATTATGAITTVVAFYSLLLTNFKGLVELGFITGSGLLLCLGAAFTVLPALLILQEGRAGTWTVARPTAFLNLFEGWSHHPRIVMVGAALLVAISLPALGKIQLDFNLLELQARGTESVDWEHRLLAEGGTSTWYGIVLARSPEEVEAKTGSLEALPSVDQVESVFSFLPEQPGEKMGAIRALRTPLEKLPAAFGGLEPVNLKRLQTTFERMRFKLGDKERFSSASDEELEQARGLLDALRARLGAGNPGGLTRALAAYQAKLFADFEHKITVLRKNLQASPMTVADLPRDLTDRFVGKEGTYPLKLIIDRQAIASLIHENCVDQGVCPVHRFSRVRNPLVGERMQDHAAIGAFKEIPEEAHEFLALLPGQFAPMGIQGSLRHFQVVKAVGNQLPNLLLSCRFILWTLQGGIFENAQGRFQGIPHPIHGLTFTRSKRNRKGNSQAKDPDPEDAENHAWPPWGGIAHHCFPPLGGCQDPLEYRTA